MKICLKCNQTKSLEDFYKQSDRKNGSSYCKNCKNQYDIQRWIKRKEKAIFLKGGCCNCCGYSKYYGALEFHHKNPSEKDVNWDKLRLRSWESITKELEKCILLCSNCHRELHQI